MISNLFVKINHQSSQEVTPPSFSSFGVAAQSFLLDSIFLQLTITVISHDKYTAGEENFVRQR